MPGRKLTIYVDEELTKLAKKAAIDKDISLSALISKLLIEYINNKKDN